MKAIRRFTVRPVLPEPLRPLSDLARNLRWSWHAGTRDLFRSVDPERWAAAGCDPVRLLGSVATERLTELAGDRDFLDRLDAVAGDLDAYMTGDRWYQAQTDRLPGPLPRLRSRGASPLYERVFRPGFAGPVIRSDGRSGGAPLSRCSGSSRAPTRTSARRSRDP